MMMKSQRKSYNWVGSAPLFWQQCAPMYYRHIQCPMSGKHDIHNTYVSPRGRLGTLCVYTPHLHMSFLPKAVNVHLENLRIGHCSYSTYIQTLIMNLEL